MTSQAPVALVTGANRGIGKEVGRLLAGAGYATILGSRDETRGASAADEIGTGSRYVVAHQLDVTDQASVDATAQFISDRFGHLDVLVNNAGAFYDPQQRAVDCDLNLASDALETNLLGAWRVCQAMIPLMCDRGGRIVNVSSGSGSLAEMAGGTPAYGVSKTALNALTRKLADELAREGILVNSVCPGWAATDMTAGAGSRSAAEAARSVIWAVEIPDDGPTGGFFRDGERLPW